MLTNIKTFNLFFFGDADAAEKSTNDRPGNPAGHDRPDGIGGTTHCLDSELAEATAVEQADASAVTHTPKTNDQGSPYATNTVN